MHIVSNLMVCAKYTQVLFLQCIVSASDHKQMLETQLLHYVVQIIARCSCFLYHTLFFQPWTSMDMETFMWLDTRLLSFCIDMNLLVYTYWFKEAFVSLSFLDCLWRERGQPYLLYIALAHMHVPLAPPLPPDTSANARHPVDAKVYADSLREMDSLVGAIKSASDDTDKDNTLIWFTG